MSALAFVIEGVEIGAVFGDDAWMKMRLTRTEALLLCTAALLGACHRDSGSAPAAASAPNAKAPVIAKGGPSAAEQTAGMVEAAVQGKSVLPAELKFELPQRPKVGQAQEIHLALIALAALTISSTVVFTRLRARDGAAVSRHKSGITAG